MAGDCTRPHPGLGTMKALPLAPARAGAATSAELEAPPAPAEAATDTRAAATASEYGLADIARHITNTHFEPSFLGLNGIR